VICTCNRPDRLRKAVESCLCQTRKPVEVIVVDDAELGKDLIGEMNEKARCAGVRFVYHRKNTEERGLTISRNIGWRMARGEIIQFIDDDAELGADCLSWVKRIFSADVNQEVAGIDFQVAEAARSRLGRRWIERCYQAAGLWQVGLRFTPLRAIPSPLLNFLSDIQPVRYLQGNCMAIRKTKLAQIGGFDEYLADYAAGEDRDISLRLGKVGTLIRITGEKVVHHSDPGGRIDPWRMGFETCFNYLYINKKNGPFGVGELLLIVYNLSLLFITEGVFALLGNRKFHITQIRGMLAGVRTFAGAIWDSNKGSCL